MSAQFKLGKARHYSTNYIGQVTRLRLSGTKIPKYLTKRGDSADINMKDKLNNNGYDHLHRWICQPFPGKAPRETIHSRTDCNG